MKTIFIGLIIVTLAFSCSEKSDINYNKYDIITKVKDISQYYNVKLDTSGNSESCIIRKYLAGAYELNYSYDLRDTEEFAPLYYSISIHNAPTLKDAIEKFNLSEITIKSTNRAIGQRFIRIDTTFHFADQNFYAVRTRADKPVGTFLLLRSENVVYTLITAGLYSKDNSFINFLIVPKIEKLKEFKLEEYDLN